MAASQSSQKSENTKTFKWLSSNGRRPFYRRLERARMAHCYLPHVPQYRGVAGRERRIYARNEPGEFGLSVERGRRQARPVIKVLRHGKMRLISPFNPSHEF